MAYFDPFCGLSGEMIVGALVDAGAPAGGLKAELAKLSLPGRPVQIAKVMRDGVVGTYLEVGGSASFVDALGQLPGRLGRGGSSNVPSEREMDASAMSCMIMSSGLSTMVKKGAVAVVETLAGASSAARDTHGEPAGLWTVHSLMEIVGTISALCLLGIECVECAPLGSWCSEEADNRARINSKAGIELLRSVPGAVDESKVDKAHVTLTGAAIMVTVASRFGRIPPMRVDGLGYGASSELSTVTKGLLRVVVGETSAADRNTEPLSSANLLTGNLAPFPQSWHTTPLTLSSHQQSGRHARLG